MWEGCEEEGRGVERVVLVTEGGRHIRSQLCVREDHSKASLALLRSILSLQFFAFKPLILNISCLSLLRN